MTTRKLTTVDAVTLDEYQHWGSTAWRVTIPGIRDGAPRILHVVADEKHPDAPDTYTDGSPAGPVPFMVIEDEMSMGIPWWNADQVIGHIAGANPNTVGSWEWCKAFENHAKLMDAQ